MAVEANLIPTMPNHLDKLTIVYLPTSEPIKIFSLNFALPCTPLIQLEQPVVN